MWCYHVNWKAYKMLNIKLLIALVYDKHFRFYRRARIKYRCSLLYSFVSAWSNGLVVIWSCDPYFLPNSVNIFCSNFRLSQVTNRLVMFTREWYARLRAKVEKLNEFSRQVLRYQCSSIFVKIFQWMRLHESVNRSHLVQLHPIWAVLERDSNLRQFCDGGD